MIEAKIIKSAARIYAEARGARKVYFVVDAKNIADDNLRKLGLDKLGRDGDAALPSNVGKVSDFNISGKEIKRRDLPMIKKSIPTYRTWKDWHGQEHSGVQHRTMDVYPIDFIHAPIERIILKHIDGGLYLTTREIDFYVDGESAVLHLANLFLECFGYFKIFDIADHKIANAPIRQLQWEVLPPGKYPWNEAKGYVEPHLQRLTPSAKGVIEHRMRLLSQYEPDFLATGRGGYSGYFVYGFAKKKAYFLESIHLNNATYVFGHDWEELSSLSKDEIINGEYEHDRIIHDGRWDYKIRQLLKGQCEINFK